MNIERLTEEYLRQLGHLKTLTKITGEYKKLLSDAVDKQGEPDASGHRWLTAGSFLLQRQKRQGDPYLNKERAEEWAKSKGLWELVHKKVEVLDEDALLQHVFMHKELEEEFATLYDKPDVTWAFITPVKEEAIEY